MAIPSTRSTPATKAGKDKITFTTEEKLHETSKDFLQYMDVMVQALDSIEREPEGFVQENGELNWGCPCLGGLPTGTCNAQFRDFQICLHNGKEEGADCSETLQRFKQCIKENAELYPNPDDPDNGVSGGKTSDSSTNKNTS